MFRKLRGKLKELDIDQAYLAEKFGVNVMTISHCMTGKKPWRLDWMYQMLDIKGVYDAIELWWLKIKYFFSKELWEKLGSVIPDSVKKWVADLIAATHLEDWWNTCVASWFTSEKWGELWDAVSATWKEGWAGIDSWWKISGLSKWWTEDVSPWFTLGRWRDLWSNGLLGIQAGWLGVKTWWSSSALVKWWAEDVAPWFTKNKWYSVMSGIKEGFVAAFNDAVTAAKNILNPFITKINEFFTFTTPETNILGKTIPSKTFELIHIPQLANGGVIPPNSEFLAVLGDQKRGTNIEAPLDTIVAAFRQVMREGSGNGKGEAVMEVDGQAFGRLVYKYGNKEAKRVGVRLAGA